MKRFGVIGIFVGLLIFSSLMVATSFAEEVKKADSEKWPSEDEFVPVQEAPQILEKVVPEYPKEAMEKKITGKVIIQALIDENGDPVKIKIAKSSGNELLDKSAVAAAKKSKYKPATMNKEPVAVWIAYPVEFVLADKAEPEQEKEKK